MRNKPTINKVQLDAIDKQLIKLLYDNARTPVTELAREIGMTAPSINERLKRLEENGAITGYRVDIEPAVLGYSLMAIVRMRQLPGKWKELEALIQAIPEFVECDKVTGEDCYIAKLYLKDISDLDPILNQVAELADTNTAIVKSSPIKRRLLL
ncbi:Lrp/AsnC family transcriptional regulator [Marinomonas sp. C2222]|uniref:Lrp/AsnC family transcriptional regulator n=1 Tax=Marinomonas sargassi TaxID=2984494 RepID=A0ABT2YPQ8_9GAMM|nr:Lrp/AsnC family transcriptional regulator [Marinomonas sargassi]MCV2401862.1 Lrp/AsnC family transcriptional regulator [Marinomonas sargassi]